MLWSALAPLWARGATAPRGKTDVFAAAEFLSALPDRARRCAIGNSRSRYDIGLEIISVTFAESPEPSRAAERAYPVGGKKFRRLQVVVYTPAS